MGWNSTCRLRAMTVRTISSNPDGSPDTGADTVSVAARALHRAADRLPCLRLCPPLLWTAPLAGAISGRTGIARPTPPRSQVPHAHAERYPLHLSELLRKTGPRSGGLQPACAAQRPDADVRQLGHGAVQEPVHRGRASRVPAGDHGAEM